MAPTKSAVLLLCLSIAGMGYAQTYAVREARIFDSISGKVSVRGVAMMAGTSAAAGLLGLSSKVAH